VVKKLEELWNLPSQQEENEIIETKDKDEYIQEAKQIYNALSNAEKIDAALSTVQGLEQHDNEMDDIAIKALNSYKDLCDLGLNVPDMYSGKIYEVAAVMLKTAMEAKDAKVQKKLKIIELQLKKARLDQMSGEGEGKKENSSNTEFDRNELLKYISQTIKSENSDK